MLADLSVEGLNQGERVRLLNRIRRRIRFRPIKPKLGTVKKVKPGPVEGGVAARVVIGAEENRRGKDSLKAFDHSCVISAVCRKMEEGQHLDGVCKVDGAASPLYSNPDGDQPVLAEWQAIVRMGNDVKEEFAIAATMDKLGGRWPAKRESAENKRPSVEGEFLPAAGTLFADQANRLDLLQPPFGNSDGGQVAANYCRNWLHCSVSVRVSVDGGKQGILCHAVSSAVDDKLLQT
jgi:hypothetical protein